MAKFESLNIDAGATYPLGIDVLNDDGTVYSLTGYTAKLQIRETPTSATALVTVNATINTTTGHLTLTIPAASTALLVKDSYVYAVELTASGGEPVYRILEGKVFVSAEVVK